MQMDTGSNSEHEERSPSFFKVVRDPSAPHLSLPNAFVKRYLRKIPRNPTLKTVSGEHSWRLKIIKMGEIYCFAHGWEKLVKDVQLCSRDIVVFWLIDAFTFQVSFLGANGCEKDPLFNKTNDDGGIVGDGHHNGENVGDDGDIVGDGHDNGENVGDDGDIVGDGHDNGEIVGCGHDNGDIASHGDIFGGDHNGESHADDEVMAEQNLCFHKVISGKSHKYYLNLPKKFVEAAGLEHKSSVKMNDHEGKEWTIGIHTERYERTRYFLSKGWFIFQRYHKLSDGDVCIFTFNKKEGVLNLAQLHKSKTPIKQETPEGGMSRKKGIPPVYGGRDVKIEDMWPPMEKACGGVKVKTEYDSGPEGEVQKRKRGRPPLKKPGGGIDVNVKIEDEILLEAEELKRKRGRPPLSGGVVKTELETEGLIGRKRVIYF